MVGRDVVFMIEKEPNVPGDVLLEVRISSAINNKGTPALRGIALDVRAGEILGRRRGRYGPSELAECITGLGANARLAASRSTAKS